MKKEKKKENEYVENKHGEQRKTRSGYQLAHKKRMWVENKSVKRSASWREMMYV